MGSKPVQTDIIQIHQSLPVSIMNKNCDMHPAKCHDIENGRKESVETAFQCLSPEEDVQPLLRGDKTKI